MTSSVRHIKFGPAMDKVSLLSDSLSRDSCCKSFISRSLNMLRQSIFLPLWSLAAAAQGGTTELTQYVNVLYGQFLVQRARLTVKARELNQVGIISQASPVRLV
jgi:hypothetical protein